MIRKVLNICGKAKSITKSHMSAPFLHMCSSIEDCCSFHDNFFAFGYDKSMQIILTSSISTLPIISTRTAPILKMVEELCITQIYLTPKSQGNILGS